MHRGWCGGMVIPDRRQIYEWAAEHINLPTSYAIPGPFNVGISRYMLEPFQAVHDDRNREIDVVAAVQTGKTLWEEICALWLLANQPASMMWTMQTDEDAKEYCKSRLNELLKSCGPIQSILPSDRHMRNTQEIYFGGFFILINGANINSLQSKSIRHKLNDEVWLWDEGLIEHAKNRVNAFRDADCSRVISVSQAGKIDSDWHKQWSGGTCRHWSVYCPGCKRHIELLRQHGKENKRAGLCWDFKAQDENGKWDVARCVETAHYMCPNCGHIWEDTDKTRMEWNRKGVYLGTLDNPLGHESFSWNALVRTKMAVLVKKLTEYENLKLKGITQPLAECYMQDFSEFVNEETFADVVEIVAGDYEMHEYFDGDKKIDGEVARFMSIDRQINRYYCLIRAYRSDGSSRLI